MEQTLSDLINKKVCQRGLKLFGSSKFHCIPEFLSLVQEQQVLDRTRSWRSHDLPLKLGEISDAVARDDGRPIGVDQTNYLDIDAGIDGLQQDRWRAQISHVDRSGSEGVHLCRSIGISGQVRTGNLNAVLLEQADPPPTVAFDATSRAS